MQNSSHEKLKILLAPLDWGLGHATRCIPVIKMLIKQGHSVYLAGNGKIETILRNEFPDLPFLSLEGYNIHYAKTKWGLPAVILLQVPKILRRISYERKWLSEIMKKHGIHVVISDNRYGLYHPGVHSVLITHQLYIKTPSRFMGRLLQRLHYYFINRFSECWVPDLEKMPSLAGALSHPSVLPSIPVRYIGPLSRFQSSNSFSANGHLLILLSGPEPQRSILEQKITEQLKEYKGQVILLRGLPGATVVPVLPSNITVRNHLSVNELEETLKNAFIVISRCGYSTVMDLTAMNKNCILVPTPGQTEQEYLARHLMEQRLALCINQKKFNLRSALSLAATFPYQNGRFRWDDSKLSEAIDNLVKKTDTPNK
jgi:UDP-N-acetylglucosamine:LPS N-acetylglucosamine transferase